MNHTDVKVGTQIVAKVGCNEVKAVITEIGENGIMARSHKSGKEFRVKTILQVESAPEVIRETPKPEKKLSLFSAAIKVMETGPAGQTYSVKELVAETIAQGLWTPGAGKTPEQLAGIVSATLRVKAEEFTLTDAATLDKLEAMLRVGKYELGGTGCPFTALLDVALETGEILTVALATDSCGVWMSEGYYYSYGGDSQPLYDLFGVTMDMVAPYNKG